MVKWLSDAKENQISGISVENSFVVAYVKSPQKGCIDIVNGKIQ